MRDQHRPATLRPLTPEQQAAAQARIAENPVFGLLESSGRAFIARDERSRLGFVLDGGTRAINFISDDVTPYTRIDFREGVPLYRTPLSFIFFVPEDDK